VPYNYDKYAQTHAFDGFLKSVQLNPEIRKFIQRSIGYSLLGIARERSFWILYGNGNNGKSIFIDLFSELLNDYASSTTSASVMNQKTDRIPNDIARLNGKRFVVIPETEENERFNASLIKALSAGDKITARFLFGEFFDFYFSGKLWIATNHKPQITDHSKGFWDRLKIIPFTIDIQKQNVIKRDILLGSLLNEAPAILNWAVQGCLEYLNKSDLDVPKSIQDEIDLYKYEQDSIAQFLDECCELDATYQTNNKDLYAKYSEFCKDAGEYQRSQRRFTQNLKERGFIQSPGRSLGRMWEGIALK
jgi:putative DNA primase/helicase